MRQAKPARRFSGRDSPGSPLSHIIGKFSRTFLRRRSEALPTSHCRSNTFPLALLDERTFGFGHIREQLQHDISYQGSSEITIRARIQEGHIKAV